MTNDPIKNIICAVRGQPESRETVTRAIDLALEHDAHLLFCLWLSMLNFSGILHQPWRPYKLFTGN